MCITDCVNRCKTCFDGAWLDYGVRRMSNQLRLVQHGIHFVIWKFGEDRQTRRCAVGRQSRSHDDIWAKYMRADDAQYKYDIVAVEHRYIRSFRGFPAEL